MTSAATAVSARRLARAAGRLLASGVALVAVTAGTGLFLAGRWTWQAIRKVPPRPVLWAGLLTAWPVTEGLQEMGWLPNSWLPSLTEALLLAGSSAYGLWRLRLRQQVEWRESRGRMHAPHYGRKEATCAIASNTDRVTSAEARLDAHDARRDRTEDKLDAALVAVHWICRQQGIAVPPALAEGPAAAAVGETPVERPRRLQMVKDDTA